MVKINHAASGLPAGKFKVILADPPWTFKVRSSKGKDRSAEQHYSVMSLDEIKAMPVQELADEDCVLLLWVTMPNLLEGLAVMTAWGFTYKTAGFVWAKKNKISGGFFMGMGYWTRSNAEICLLGTRGNPSRKEDGKDVPQLLTSRIREHSRKPEETHSRIERLVEGPYLELFARAERQGWTTWGNQTDKFNEKETEAS